MEVVDWLTHDPMEVVDWLTHDPMEVLDELIHDPMEVVDWLIHDQDYVRCKMCPMELETSASARDFIALVR